MVLKGRFQYIICLLFGLWTFDSFATACFKQHIKDAIVLNKARRDTYKSWGGAKASRLSRELVLMEKLLLIGAKRFDKKALKWQKMGVPFLCLDLVDMKLAPLMPSKPVPIDDAPVEYVPLEYKLEKDRLSQHISRFDWSSAFQELEFMRHQTEVQTYAHCLTRHFVESMQRSAFLAPQYENKIADEKDKREFRELMNDYLKLHIFGLTWARRLDRLAYPLQRQGLGLFCNDIPPIDVTPNLDF